MLGQTKIPQTAPLTIHIPLTAELNDSSWES